MDGKKPERLMVCVCTGFRRTKSNLTPAPTLFSLAQTAVSLWVDIY